MHDDDNDDDDDDDDDAVPLLREAFNLISQIRSLTRFLMFDESFFCSTPERKRLEFQSM